jgi:hypothetical protein
MLAGAPVPADPPTFEAPRMTKPNPEFHDAELLLRVYDLRREPLLREARAAIVRQFWPRTYEDIRAVNQPDHPLNAFFRQTSTYWEMVYGIARHGIVSPNYWAEFNGEGLFLFAKVAPFVAELRRDTSPSSFRNAEWIANECSEGRRLFELFQARVKKTLETRT